MTVERVLEVKPRNGNHGHVREFDANSVEEIRSGTRVEYLPEPHPQADIGLTALEHIGKRGLHRVRSFQPWEAAQSPRVEIDPVDLDHVSPVDQHRDVIHASEVSTNALPNVSKELGSAELGAEPKIAAAIAIANAWLNASTAWQASS